ncbi:MAG TPA: glycosyltransferase family 39 protein [Patescibacteria group bacterium]|nr:glycosyltransferase family 39 protein [Patescibacteria group bacterium]
MKKISFIILVLILALSFFLGARMLLGGDFYYLYDQARDYLLAQNIVNTHSLILIGDHSGLGGFFHGPLWIYMFVPIYLLGNGNPMCFAYFYACIPVLTVFIAYILGTKLYDQKAGSIFALLLALSPITWGTVANTISNNLEPLVYLFLFYFLIRFLRGYAKSFILVAFFTGLSLQFETSSALMLIPTIFVIFLFNIAPAKNRKVIGWSILAYLVSITTFILFDIRHNFLMLHSLLNSFGGTKQRGYLELNDRLPAHFNSMLGAYKSVLFNDNIILVILFAVIIIFAVVLFLIEKNKEYKREFFYLLLFPLLFYAFFLVYPYYIWANYVYGLLVPVAIVFLLAIITIWRYRVGKVLVVVFFAVTFFYVSSYLHTQYFKPYQPDTTAGSYLNQKAVVQWLYADAGTGKYGHFVYSQDTFTVGMDYLIPWYGKNQKQTSFESQKDKITYLIMYPHQTNDEGAYDFWKKNVLHTNGQVLMTKSFAGDITVEKLAIIGQEPAVDPNYYQNLIFR